MEITTLASGSTANCYVISDGKTSVLVECGLKWNKVAEYFQYNILRRVKGVFVSHEHSDHSRGVKQAAAAGLNVYASAGTLSALGLSPLDNYHYKTIKHGGQVAVGTFIVMPFNLKHDAAEPLGFLFYSTVTGERLLFATDTAYIHWQFPSVEYLMIESNYAPDILKENIENRTIDRALAPRLMQSHMSIDTALAFIEHQDLSKTKKIVLLHLSQGNSDPEGFCEAVTKRTGIPTEVAGGR